MLNRRAFLGQSAGVAIIAGAVSAIGTEAVAAPLKTVTASATPTLLKMARDLYPHDRLPNGFYETALATIDAKVAAEPGSAKLLSDGVANLDKIANGKFGKPYLDIVAEADRVAVLKAIEGTPFFTRMRGEMITALYNQEELWAKLGYEGSSAEHGGYIHRGFNDIDWLPA
ncbi:gluconate 2-dehydrogenase subunit 3 family protein [Sphingobium sp.]|uniref:gluconate 2-dehydrogenase subunit 3 family protein n=1 Tax=Sphingobium sp. TaxID=1912891 RepID=UPI0028BE36EB|nr:gluconate 2-dehydrogenase subunit 3 family protein [Sphingobium sp.]